MVSKAELSQVPEVDTKTYFNELSKRFRIGNVYYPGSGDDESLEEVFGPEELVYFDNESDRFRFYSDWDLKEREVEGRIPHVKGTFNNPPFATSTFDAIFMQDIHADREELSNIVETLRPGGILVFSKNDCSYHKGSKSRNPDLGLVRKNPTLREVSLPVSHEYLVTFRKVPPLPQGPKLG